MLNYFTAYTPVDENQSHRRACTFCLVLLSCFIDVERNCRPWRGNTMVTKAGLLQLPVCKLCDWWPIYFSTSDYQRTQKEGQAHSVWTEDIKQSAFISIMIGNVSVWAAPCLFRTPTTTLQNRDEASAYFSNKFTLRKLCRILSITCYSTSS